jgi:hypothetical protein
MSLFDYNPNNAKLMLRRIKNMEALRFSGIQYQKGQYLEPGLAGLGGLGGGRHHFELTNDDNGNDADTFTSLVAEQSPADHTILEVILPGLAQILPGKPAANKTEVVVQSSQLDRTPLCWVKRITCRGSVHVNDAKLVLSTGTCTLLQLLAKRAAEQNKDFDKAKFQTRLLNNVERVFYSNGRMERTAILQHVLQQQESIPERETLNNLLATTASQSGSGQKGLSSDLQATVLNQLKAVVPLEQLIDSLLEGMKTVA